MLAALADFEPDAVLIEGPADADRVLDWVLADGMEPPLALLAYAPGGPARGGILAVRRLLPRVAGDDLGLAAASKPISATYRPPSRWRRNR